MLNGLPWKWTEIILLFFEIPPKHCISDLFVDCEGYSISSKGFLTTVVDITVIWIKFTELVHFSSWIPQMLMFILAIYFCLFILLMWRSWQKYRSGWPFSPPVHYTCQHTPIWPKCTWVALNNIAHSFIELHKPLYHDKDVIYEVGNKLQISQNINLKRLIAYIFLFVIKTCKILIK